MRSFAVLFLLIIFAIGAFPQKPKPTKNNVKPAETPVSNLANEKEEFEKAAAMTDLTERIAALQKFIIDFPKSREKTRALELIVSARAQLGDEKLRIGENDSGIAFFKSAVAEAPTPVSDQLFSLLLQFPTNLFSLRQSTAAIDIAKLIEEKIGENPKQLLALATYYLGTENAFEAKRIAENVIRIETALPERSEKPNLPGAYQALGLANRMNFDFAGSVSAYATALELDAVSVVSRRSLAEMKRAVGKPDEAIALYNEILATNANDAAAQTGLILSQFDAGKRREAETEMAKSLEANPNNLFLLAGAAYWYAAHSDGAKAIELAEKALTIEPRYTWAHIALARGYMAQKQPLEAERILLTARQFGDFPTLDYELASARFRAGFFREAGDILRRNFSVKNDYVKAWMGNRVPLEAMSFTELLAVERQASIFQPLPADSAETSERLKSLLEFVQKVDLPDASDGELAALGEKFVAGEDNMKLYRQLFVAKKLLQQKKALPKVLELTRAMTGKVDSALAAPDATAAVLADQLYDSRSFAISRGEVVVVPTIEKQTLSRILRGEIEEVAGGTLFEQNRAAEAIVRLKRGLSILPEKSAWWRSSMWRFGAALEADGKRDEALDTYIKAYLSDAPNAGKYLTIEVLYQKINGSTDGLVAKIGSKPVLLTSQVIAQNTFPAALATPAPKEPSEIKTEAPIKEDVESPAMPSFTPTPVPSPLPTPTPQEVENEQNPAEVPLPTPTPQKTEAEENPAETPQPIPADEKTMEPISTPTPTPTPAVQTENTNNAAVKTESETKPSDVLKNPKTEKPLFEPVIITIPKPVTLAKVDSEKIESGETRARKVDRTKEEEITPCVIVASQNELSILSDGGNLGVLVGFESEGDLRQIKAVSSSPADIEIIAEPEIPDGATRALFLIRSISQKKGAFTVTFESACGKKEILVKVR